MEITPAFFPVDALIVAEAVNPPPDLRQEVERLQEGVEVAGSTQVVQAGET